MGVLIRHHICSVAMGCDESKRIGFFRMWACHAQRYALPSDPAVNSQGWCGCQAHAKTPKPWKGGKDGQKAGILWKMASFTLWKSLEYKYTWLYLALWTVLLMEVLGLSRTSMYFHMLHLDSDHHLSPNGSILLEFIWLTEAKHTTSSLIPQDLH